MSNIFNDLSRYTDSMFNENKPYWNSDNGFSRVVGPNGEIVDEESIFKETQQSDLNRLRQSEK